MFRRYLMAFFLLALTQESSANYQDLKALYTQVSAYVLDYLDVKYGSRSEIEDIQISVNPLDSRLKLAACDEHLKFTINETQRNLSRVTVKVSCEDIKKWSIYVPTSVKLMGNVIVSSRNINRGEVIDDADLTYQLANIAQTRGTYLVDMDRASGMELKRNIRAGEIVSLQNLVMPDVIEKGQEITIESASPFLKVSAQAVALKSGHVGEQIKVRNSHSERIVSATVVGPGLVRTQP